MSEPHVPVATTTRGGTKAGAPRRIGSAAVLAVALPLATFSAAWLVPTGQPTLAEVSPEAAPLTRFTLGCPAAVDQGTSRVRVGSALAEDDGEVAIDPLRDGPRPLPVRAGQLADVAVEGAVVVTGEGSWAPGLLAGRSGAGAGLGCAEPQPDAWYAGVGARPGHHSVLELVNPDPGPAIADLTLFAPSGPLDVPDLRGIRVSGRSAVELDLATVTPRRTELALHVLVSRGRLTSAVRDTVDRLGGGPVASDWLVAQGRPATSATLLGLPPGSGPRRLTLVNGGDSEARVDVRVVSPESVFAPEGLGEVNVPPHSVRSVSLDTVLTAEVRAGAIGLQVEATHPIAVGLQSFVDGDLTHAVTGMLVEESGAVLVPGGAQQLLLAGASRPGVVTVVTRAGGGRRLGSERVEIGPDRGVAVDLPRAARYVEVLLERTAAVASVLATGPGGAAVLPVRPVIATGLVPDVRPTRP